MNSDIQIFFTAENATRGISDDKPNFFPKKISMFPVPCIWHGYSLYFDVDI